MKRIGIHILIVLLFVSKGYESLAHNPAKDTVPLIDYLGYRIPEIDIDKRTGKITPTGYWIPDRIVEVRNGQQINKRIQSLPKGKTLQETVKEVSKKGPFIRLGDGSILSMEDGKRWISKDEGKSWTATQVSSEPGKPAIPGASVLIRTRGGVLIMAFINLKEKANWHWKDMDSPGATLPTYAARSLDDGRTWQDIQKLHDDWTGAISDIIETRDGNVVFTSMMMRHNPGRHTVLTYTTKDQGKSWIRSNVIDLGGIGNHAGVTESTLVQLKDGRLWMLMRTNWGRFWETYSDDDGLTWKDFGATKIDASASPGHLHKLQSGRLVLLWNRLYPEGKKEFFLMRAGDGNFSEVDVSWHREELAIMFSDDDGKTWGKPSVIARITRRSIQLVCYPYLFEAKPGELWITIQSALDLPLKVYERDFVSK